MVDGRLEDFHGLGADERQVMCFVDLVTPGIKRCTSELVEVTASRV